MVVQVNSTQSRNPAGVAVGVASAMSAQGYVVIGKATASIATVQIGGVSGMLMSSL